MMRHVGTTDPLPNILLRLVSWYGRMTVDGFRSMSRLALIVSLRKSYSSSIGYSSSLHRFLTSCNEIFISTLVRVVSGETHIYLCIVDLEGVDIVVVLVHLVCGSTMTIR